MRQDDRERDEAVSLLVAPRRPALFDECAARRLTWWPEIGVGYYPVEEGSAPYDRAYFERFAAQADSDIGRALMDARVAFVGRHWTGDLIDVGIGSGAFIEARLQRGDGPTRGYDVCPAALVWLRQRGLFANPHVAPAPSSISLWDVLEHIPDFPALLDNVKQWVFISIPIFRDCDHVLRSKHFRPQEHVWYFTLPGLKLVMMSLGFECVEQSDVETKIGREDIGTFAFRRT